MKSECNRFSCTLSVYDGVDDTGILLDVVMGVHSDLVSFNTTNSSLYVSFKSDASYQ